LSTESHYILDYNSCISWWIFILFVPIETEMNILQRSYYIHHVILPVSPHYYLVKLKTAQISIFWSYPSQYFIT